MPAPAPAAAVVRAFERAFGRLPNSIITKNGKLTCQWHVTGHKQPREFAIDFLDKKLRDRTLDMLRKSSDSTLLSAVSTLPSNPAIIDATAGLGRDALALAMTGARVLMIERNLGAAALLADALLRVRCGSVAFSASYNGVHDGNSTSTNSISDSSAVSRKPCAWMDRVMQVCTHNLALVVGDSVKFLTSLQTSSTPTNDPPPVGNSTTTSSRSSSPVPDAPFLMLGFDACDLRIESLPGLASFLTTSGHDKPRAICVDPMWTPSHDDNTSHDTNPVARPRRPRATPQLSVQALHWLTREDTGGGRGDDILAAAAGITSVLLHKQPGTDPCLPSSMWTAQMRKKDGGAYTIYRRKSTPVMP